PATVPTLDTSVVPRARSPPRTPLFPYTTLFRSRHIPGHPTLVVENKAGAGGLIGKNQLYNTSKKDGLTMGVFTSVFGHQLVGGRSEEHTSELQSRSDLVCRLLLEKKKKQNRLIA